MISQTAEYALRAIVFLADNAGEAHTTEQIARATKVPVGYLAKIMQGLSRSRLVNSQRGLHGGFTLVREPRELSIYDVVQAVDPTDPGLQRFGQRPDPEVVRTQAREPVALVRDGFGHRRLAVAQGRHGGVSADADGRDFHGGHRWHEGDWRAL